MSRRRTGVSIALGVIALLGTTTSVFAAGGAFVERDVQVLQTFSSAEASGSFGWAVSGVADPKHKHRQNALIGEAFNGPSFDQGSAHLYSSRTGELLYRFDGAAGDWFGFSVADAGDVDRDKANDILVGAPGADETHPGYADLYSGRTGALLHRFVGEQGGDSFGWSVSSAGDVDGDKRPDLLIGAPAYNGHAHAGRAYLYSGATYELIRTLEGEAQGDEFGSGAGSTADVDRDRVPDQIVGAREALAADGRPRGKVYVYSGATGARLFTIDPVALSLQLGSFFVAGVGDVNGDKTPDIYAGDYADRTNGILAGRAGVYSGRDGSELLSWLGAAPNDGLGPGRGAGDVNGDGRPDIVVGSYSSSAGAEQAGKVQLFSGADGSLLRTITSTTAGENLGFDAVGLGDVNGDEIPDALVSAATGDRVYILAGTAPGKP